MGTNASSPAGNRSLLLSSMREFESLLEPLLGRLAPRSLCEIGVGDGRFMEFLIGYARANGCLYTAIDPAIAEAVAGRHADERIRFVKSRSLEALPNLPSHDLYFIDGDHNYYTVRQELNWIVRRSASRPLILLHDVGWPWGRRDQYCDSGSIPPADCHPNSTSLGVRPGRNELGDGGFSGRQSDYTYAAAMHEGGPRNGVLTAVEDFLAEDGRKAGWQWVVVPMLFGLGVLYHPETCPPEMTAFIRRTEEGLAVFQGLMARVESNRVDLFLAFLDGVRQFTDLHGEYDALRAAYAKLDTHCHGLQDEYEKLMDAYKGLQQQSAR